MAFKYIVLGIIQGLTEFLPVSSSGHLVIMQRLLGIAGKEVTLSVVLHLGTLCALLLYFGKDVSMALRNRKLLTYIVVVTLITGAIGLSGKDFFEALFSRTRPVAFALMVTGIVLLLTRKRSGNKRTALTAKDAVALGVTQGIAIIPGISRSGITISTLLFRGMDRESSFRLSFLLSMPAIIGAALLEAKDVAYAFRLEPKNFIFGFIFAFAAGIFSLRLLKGMLRRGIFHYFGYYCIGIAVFTLLFLP